MEKVLKELGVKEEVSNRVLHRLLGDTPLERRICARLNTAKEAAQRASGASASSTAPVNHVVILRDPQIC